MCQKSELAGWLCCVHELLNEASIGFISSITLKVMTNIARVSNSELCIRGVVGSLATREAMKRVEPSGGAQPGGIETSRVRV